MTSHAGFWPDLKAEVHGEKSSPTSPPVHIQLKSLPHHDFSPWISSRNASRVMYGWRGYERGQRFETNIYGALHPALLEVPLDAFD